MKFSKRVHYGLVFLMQLHYAWPGYKAVKELADADALPHKFLEGIASDFRKGKLVEVKRGAQGGYRLSRPLEEMSFLELLRCLDPEWERKKTDAKGAEESSKQEAVSQFLYHTSKSVDEVFDKLTLDALPKIYAHDDSLMYYI